MERTATNAIQMSHQTPPAGRQTPSGRFVSDLPQRTLGSRAAHPTPVQRPEVLIDGKQDDEAVERAGVYTMKTFCEMLHYLRLGHACYLRNSKFSYTGISELGCSLRQDESVDLTAFPIKRIVEAQELRQMCDSGMLDMEIEVRENS